MIGLKVIIGYNILVGLFSLVVIIFDETKSEIPLNAIQILVSLFVVYGLIDRNEFARKATIALYSFGLLIHSFQMYFVIPYFIENYSSEVEINYITVLALNISFFMSIFTVFYLLNSKVREEYGKNF